jgi:hypothetical protein
VTLPSPPTTGTTVEDLKMSFQSTTPRFVAVSALLLASLAQAQTAAPSPLRWWTAPAR